MHSPNTLCILQQHLKEYGRQAVRNWRCYLIENLDICKMAKKFFCFLSRRSKIPLLYMYALKILVLFKCFCSSSWDWIWTKVNGPYFPIKDIFYLFWTHMLHASLLRLNTHKYTCLVVLQKIEYLQTFRSQFTLNKCWAWNSGVLYHPLLSVGRSQDQPPIAE